MKQTYFGQTGLKMLCLASIFILGLESCGTHRVLNTVMKNRQNLERLSIGMSRDQVIAVMGSKTIKTLWVNINSPYRIETLKDVNNQNLEILFFYTEEKDMLFTMSEDELTPVVLKEGKVEGWGRIYLAEIAPSYRYDHRYYERQRGSSKLDTSGN